MRNEKPIPNRPGIYAWAALSLSLLAAARADTIAFSSGLNYPGVHIDRIEDGKVYFVINGELRSKPAADIVTMSVDDEPDFDSGEAAYQSQNYASAADGYSRAIGGADKPWLRD